MDAIYNFLAKLFFLSKFTAYLNKTTDKLALNSLKSQLQKADLRTVPIECNMFAGPSTPLPFVSKLRSINFISNSCSPSCYRARSYFTSRSIDSLNSLTRRGHWTGQRFTFGNYLSWYLCAPVSKVFSNVKLYRSKF